jgi:hypothetical protein
VTTAVSRKTARRRRLSPGERAERLAKAREGFEAALGRLRSEERFRQFLAARRRMHRYSLRNLLWLLAQKPRTELPVASYRTWRHRLGYQVRRGERGLSVWVPRPVKRREADPESGEEVERVIPRFGVGRVFDRSQVEPIEGRALELDPPSPAPIEGKSHARLIAPLEAHLRERGYAVVRRRPEPPLEAAAGWQDPVAREVGLAPGQPPNGELATLVHEAAHVEIELGYRELGRGRCEALVETVAFLVCDLAGLDTAGFSVPYVAAWAREDAALLERDVALIEGAANRLAEAMGVSAAAADEPPTHH